MVSDAAAQSCAPEAAVVDEAVEDCECLGAVEAGRGADVTVGDRTRRGEVEDDVGEFGAAELQAGGWP